MRFPIRLFRDHTSIDFISKKYYAFIFSLTLTIGVVLLLVFKGINLGIDFAGGVVIEMECSDSATTDELRHVLSSNHYRDFNIQDFRKGDKHKIMLRLRPSADETKRGYDKQSLMPGLSQRGADNGQAVMHIKTIITDAMVMQGQKVEFTKVEYVGPKVGSDFVLSAIFAMSIALVIMMFYTWVRFDLVYGIGVIVALFHDAIATLGLYVVAGYEFDLSSIAAILTVIGYSINDSVVIYDRIRENMNKYRGKTFDYIINLSINETLARSIMTLSTTLLVCIILALFGGDTLHGFSVAILFGIAFGAYSSIYISAPILILFHDVRLPSFVKRRMHSN